MSCQKVDAKAYLAALDRKLKARDGRGRLVIEPAYDAHRARVLPWVDIALFASKVLKQGGSCVVS